MPFKIKFERRLETPLWLGPLMPCIAIGGALILGALILLSTGLNPIDCYVRMFQAAFTMPGALSATLLSATPILLTGLTAALSFRMRAWNIGGDGQLMIGAVFAAAAGFALGEFGLIVSLPSMAIAGALGGALWVAIPAYFRSRFGTNEVLTTLMLNYIAPLVLAYLVFDSKSYWRDLTSPSARFFPQGKSIPEEAFWPALGGDFIPIGFLLGVLIAILLAVALKRTKFGFEIRVAADSTQAGKYAGIKTNRVFVIVMLLSAAFAGIAGASQIGDFSHRLEPRALQFAAYGYTGIAVAALARYKPIGVVFSAVFIGGVMNAGVSLQGADLPLGLVGLILGLILLFVASSEISARYRVVIWKASKIASPIAAQSRSNMDSLAVTQPIEGAKHE